MCCKTDKKVIVFGRSPDNTEALVNKAARHYGIEATSAKAREELAEADIVCTATTSLTPVFAAEHIAPGTHINGIGSYRPDMTEIPAQTVADAKVVVDQREACLKEAGDLMVPISRGDFNESHIYAELGDILMGNVEGRTNDSEITFFKSVGNAVQDLVVASFLEEQARQENLGTEVAL